MQLIWMTVQNHRCERVRVRVRESETREGEWNPFLSPGRLVRWNMGGVRSFRIESKRFDLIREGNGVDAVSLLEIGRYMRHLVTMGKEGARWLRKCIEENIVRETENAFVRTFREQDKGYVIRRFENKCGRYLEIADYGRGGCKG